MKSTVSLSKSNDKTYTSQVKQLLFVLKELKKNSFYKMKMNLATLLTNDMDFDLPENVEKTYAGSTLFIFNNVISKYKY
jgi:hypothetical protein